MYLHKNQQAKNVKQEMIGEKMRFANDMHVLNSQISERKEKIHTQRESAKNAV